MSNEQELLKRSLWMKLYSEKRLELIRVINEMENGDMKVIVHQKEPTRIMEPLKSKIIRPRPVDNVDLNLERK